MSFLSLFVFGVVLLFRFFFCFVFVFFFLFFFVAVVFLSLESKETVFVLACLFAWADI